MEKRLQPGKEMDINHQTGPDPPGHSLEVSGREPLYIFSTNLFHFGFDFSILNRHMCRP